MRPIIGKKLLDYENGHVAFECPGCKHPHAIRVDGRAKPNWSYNGDPDSPTFHPSILVRTGHHVQNQPKPPNCWHCNNRDDGHSMCSICHSFVENGNIRFLNDCTHALAGQTVPLPDLKQEDDNV